MTKLEDLLTRTRPEIKALEAELPDRTDGIAVSWQPVVIFKADSEPEMFQAISDWCREHLGGLAVLATWSRYVDRDEVPYEAGIVLEG